MRKLLFAAAALLALIAGSSGAAAQDLREEVLKQLAEVRSTVPTTAPAAASPAAGDSEAEALAAVPEIEQLRRLTERLKSEESLASADWSSKSSRTLLSHIKGSDGIPFPSPAAVVLEPTPTPPEASPTPTPTPQPTPTPYPPPRKCQENRTVRDALSPVDGREVPLYDFIFLSRDLVPIDPSEVYGEHASLLAYDSPYTEGQLLRMEIYLVPCVPYRVRLTSTAKYYDFGLNALRNYDKGQAGRGTLSTWVEQKLFGAPQRRRR